MSLTYEDSEISVSLPCYVGAKEVKPRLIELIKEEKILVVPLGIEPRLHGYKPCVFTVKLQDKVGCIGTHILKLKGK